MPLPWQTTRALKGRASPKGEFVWFRQEEEKVVRTSVFATSCVISLGVLGLASAAHGAILTSNLPAVNGAGAAEGIYSDAYSTNGNQFYGQSIATGFSVNNSWNLTQLTFWGFSENFFQAGLGNVAGFQMQILSADFSTVVVNQTWTLAQLAVQATGNIGNTGGIEYQFAGTIAGAITAGSYWLNVGFIANDPNGDGWAWTTGMNAASAVGAAFSDGDGGWTNWAVNEQQASLSHILFGQIVPAPGALALLMAGGLAGGTRRRR